MAIEEQWFKVLVIIVAAILIIVAAYNINTYRLLRGSQHSPINGEESNTLLVVNVIILVFGIILFIWGIYRLLLAKDYREKLESRVSKAVTSTEYGFSPEETTVTVTKPAGTSVTVTKPIAPTVVTTAVSTSKPTTYVAPLSKYATAPLS